MKTARQVIVCVLCVALGAVGYAQSGGQVVDTWAKLLGGGNQSAIQSYRARFVAELNSAVNTMAIIKGLKTELDAAVTATSDPTLTALQTDWNADFVAAFNTFAASGPASIVKLAQLVADVSETAGIEGGNNELRVFQGNATPTKVAVTQDQ